MFGLGKHHLVPLAQVLAAPGMGNEVYRFGRAAGKDEPGRLRSAEEDGDLLTGLLVGRRRLLCQPMHGPVDVGVMLLVVSRERLDDPARLLGGRGVIQIHELLLAYPALQDGEVLTDFLYVIHPTSCDST